MFNVTTGSRSFARGGLRQSGAQPRRRPAVDRASAFPFPNSEPDLDEPLHVVADRGWHDACFGGEIGNGQAGLAHRLQKVEPRRRREGTREREDGSRHGLHARGALIFHDVVVPRVGDWTGAGVELEQGAAVRAGGVVEVAGFVSSTTEAPKASSPCSRTR